MLPPSSINLSCRFCRSEAAKSESPEATRTKLADQGLLMPVRTDDKGHQQYAVAWVAKNIRSSPADISARAWGHRRAPVQAERVARWRPLSAAAALKDRLVQSQRIDLALDVAEGGPIEEAFIGIDPQDLAQGYFGGGASLVGR